VRNVSSRDSPRTPPTIFRICCREAFGDTAPHGVIHFRSLDTDAADGVTAESLAAAQESGCRSVLHLVQAMGRMGWQRPPRFWLITRCIDPVGLDYTQMNLSHTPLSGLGRAITFEHPELRFTEVDLGPETAQAGLSDLIQEFFTDRGRDRSGPAQRRTLRPAHGAAVAG
jgi:hypothetical protein